MMRRAAVAVLSSATLLGGLLVGASPASAAAVTLQCENDSKAISLPVNETLNISVAHCTIQSTSGVGSFSPSSGYVYPGPIVFSSATAGTASLTIYGAGNNPTVLTINVGGASATVTDPALVYPTAYINPNGGTCTGTLQFTKVNGQNGTITTPTSSACTRTGYTLRGWARSDDARSAEWAPDVTVPIGTDSFTLYAVWAANGVEVTYDANVGLATPCLAAGVDLPTAPERRSTSVVTPASSGQAVSVGSDGIVRWTSAAPASPCTPVGYTLAGWSTSPTGAVRAGGQANDIVTSGDGIPSSGRAAAGADRLTLYAVWSAPTYGISLTSPSTSLKPSESVTVTAKATINGAPAANASIAVEVPASAPVTLAGGGVSVMLTTNSIGEATFVAAAKSGNTLGMAAMTAAYGNKTAELELTVAAALTIVITGERTTVSGKSGVRIEGFTTGLRQGATVTPYFRFPGETTFSQGSARPVIDANGGFIWERKTGKKFYAYVETESGARSNRVIIPAN